MSEDSNVILLEHQLQLTKSATANIYFVSLVKHLTPDLVAQSNLCKFVYQLHTDTFLNYQIQLALYFQ